MFTKFILVKAQDGQYLSYDEEADSEWYLSLSKQNACKFTCFSEFERTYEILNRSVLHNHTEFSIELLYIRG